MEKRRSKGGCVHFILQIGSKCGLRGVKNPKIWRMSFMDAPRARWRLGRTEERPFGGHFTLLECCIKFQLEVYASLNGRFMLAHYVQELHLMMGLGDFIKIEMSCWNSNISCLVGSQTCLDFVLHLPWVAHPPMQADIMKSVPLKSPPSSPISECTSLQLY